MTSCSSREQATGGCHTPGRTLHHPPHNRAGPTVPLEAATYPIRIPVRLPRALACSRQALSAWAARSNIVLASWTAATQFSETTLLGDRTTDGGPGRCLGRRIWLGVLVLEQQPAKRDSNKCRNEKGE